MPAPFSFHGDNATFLAPMQDICDARFMDIVASRGVPDFFVSEYVRIHEFFNFDSRVLEAAANLHGGRPVCLQFIGSDPKHIGRAIAELSKYPEIKMLDLNLGCPAPKIYKKDAGGGLLRHPEKISSILRAMRSAWSGVLSVKMRLGFYSADEFPRLLDCVLENSPDFISVHARTVSQLYRGECDYSKIAYAVSAARIPVIANGDIVSAKKAKGIIDATGCAGVMVGRHAVRNPWIFRQIRETLSGREVYQPRLSDVRAYVDELAKAILSSDSEVRHPDSRLKKFLNFIGLGIDPEGAFLYKMRRSRGMDELMAVCDEFMLENSAGDKYFPFEPYPQICSRPNKEL